MKIDDEKWHFVSGVLDGMQKQEDIFSAAIKGLMIAPESPLIDSLFVTEGTLITTLSYLIGDPFETLSWFAFECDYGRDAKEAGISDIRLIDSHDKLRWLLELNDDAD